MDMSSIGYWPPSFKVFNPEDFKKCRANLWTKIKFIKYPMQYSYDDGYIMSYKKNDNGQVLIYGFRKKVKQ